MKVLWLCNIMLPAIARKFGLPFSNREGWLSGTYERLIQEENPPIELGICFPLSAVEGNQIGPAATAFAVGPATGYWFQENLDAPERYDRRLEEQLKKILADFKPAVVHIFGTEFPHASALVRVWERPARILLGIQGLCGRIAEVYTDGLPTKVVNRVTFRDWLRRDSLKRQQAKFFRRGQYETEMIGAVRHITGRTGFDREYVTRLNPTVNYYHMNETMRDCFYTGRWEGGESGRIFLSQGDYPIKGFHEMLKAMPLILRHQPVAHLYVAGNKVAAYASLKDKIKISSYGKYLHELIAEFGLQKRVTVLGKLDGEGMKAQYLKSSVFVCPSIIENSPNAVAEAMLLGVPVVAAATGGIPDLLTAGREGLLYQPGDAAALAAAVGRAWMPETAGRLSVQAATRAAKTHNRDSNYERLMELYHEINLSV